MKDLAKLRDYLIETLEWIDKEYKDVPGIRHDQYKSLHSSICYGIKEDWTVNKIIKFVDEIIKKEI